MLKNKKSIDLSLTLVVVAAMLLVTAVVILAITGGLFKKESNQAHSLIGDSDGDGILDMADKCPCTFGVNEFGGCESSAQLKQYQDDATKIDRTCIIKKV